MKKHFCIEFFSHRTQRVLIICAIFTIFFCIVLLNITRTSVWGDEGFSVMTIGGGNGIKASMENFWNLIMADNHPFLYNFLLYFYAKVFGYSDGVLRFFSALWICVGGVVGYLLLRRHAGGGAFSTLFAFLYAYTKYHILRTRITQLWNDTWTFKHFLYPVFPYTRIYLQSF
ncbi:hypothetical protein [Helicobacter cinaedi]|uniref:hypothetical protein n=1 Tax=Helicobacter cinaedi TaxID=213 RepID=UPI001C7D8A69|nr:hypothetical protein [Helicobacter cinaedi]